MTPFHVGAIPVRLHPTFVWLVSGFVLWSLLREGVSAAVLAGLGVLAFFGSVLFHELGHAWAARAFGIRTRSIVLLPIGGAAQLELPGGRIRPAADLLVSAAGPAASILLGFVVGVVWFLLPWPPLLTLAAVNVALGCFNLLPAFPMDGGRVLRAVAVTALGPARGVQLTLIVGGVLAALFLVGGLVMGEVGLVVLAVWLGLVQTQEWRTAALARALGAAG